MVYKDWLPDDKELREALQRQLMANPTSMSQLGRDIGVSTATITSFMAGKKRLVLTSRIKMVKFLKRILLR